MVLVHALSHCFAEPHLVLAVSSVCRRKGHWLRGFGNGCSFWVLTSHCMLWYLTGCCFIYVLHWGNLAHVLAARLHGSWARSLSALPIPRSIAQGEQMSLLSEACYMCRILLFCLCRIDQLRGDKVTGLCLFPVYLEHWRDSNALMPCTINQILAWSGSQPVNISGSNWSRVLHSYFTAVILKNLILLEDACMLVLVVVLYVKNVLTLLYNGARREHIETRIFCFVLRLWVWKNHFWNQSCSL